MKPGRAIFVIAALAIALLSACSGAAPGGSGSPTAAPVGSPGSSSPPVSSINTGVPPEVTLAKLIRDSTTYDGQTLLVTGGNYYAANGLQLLCDGFLESYPPQPAGNQVGLAGQLPEVARAQLQSTGRDPTLAAAVWGQVSVIGIFHAETAASAAYLDMQSIRVELGQPAID